MIHFKSTCPYCLNEAFNFLVFLGPCKPVSAKVSETYGTISCCKCGKVFIAYFNVLEGEYQRAKEAINSLERSFYFNTEVLQYVPEPEKPYTHEAFPEKVNHFLKELHTLQFCSQEPALIVTTVRSLIEYVLKDLNIGSERASLYERIQEALKQGLITRPVAEWAHIVRKWGNLAVHEITATPSEAKEAIEFFKLLIDLLYKIPFEIKKFKSHHS